MKLIKEFAEKDEQKINELFKLVDTLKRIHGIENNTCLDQETPMEDKFENVSFELEDNTITQGVFISMNSKSQFGELNINKSEQNSSSQEVEEDKEPIDNMRY